MLQVDGNEWGENMGEAGKAMKNQAEDRSVCGQT